MTRAAEPLEDPTSAAYISWCIDEREPRNTVRRRRAVLRSVGNAGTATREDIETWWASRRHLAATTRANDLAILRGFYRWCQEWEHRPTDPSIRLRAPRTGTGAPKPVSRSDFDRILEQVAEQPALRRAVLLGAWAGLRREEVAQLDWRDVDLDTRQARVKGKGGKTRSVSLGDRLIAQLLPEDGRHPGAGNVVTGRDRGWAPDTLGRKVNDAMRAAGVAGTFHKLRHRYGTVAYQRTKDPRAIADQMGHASVNTTMSFYAAAADDAGQAIADAVSDD